MLLLEISLFEVCRPVGFVQVSKHFLFEFILSVVDDDRIVVLVQASFTCYDRVLLNMADVRCSLSGLDLTSRHDHFFLDVTETVNHHLSLH
jgi:hypothetical protein